MLGYTSGSDAREGSMGDFNGRVCWNLLGKSLKGYRSPIGSSSCAAHPTDHVRSRADLTG
jgi:hypothetical protein